MVLREILEIGDPSSFFEEFVGAMFDGLGCGVESQPSIHGRLSDYLATTPDGESFYVEATVLKPKVKFSEPRPTEEDRRAYQEVGRNMPGPLPDIPPLTSARGTYVLIHSQKRELTP